MERFNWDANNDGKITNEDLLLAFDTNHDGVLDASELQTFTEQLAAQLEYNNQLLEQIQTLERDKFSLQKELHSKQEQIISGGKGNENLREEIKDLVHRLKTTQDIVETLTKQLRECRLENANLKKNAENFMNIQVLAQSDLDNAKKEIQQLKKVISDSDQSKAQLVSQLDKIDGEWKRKNDILSEMNDTLTHEIKEIRTQKLAVDSHYREAAEQIQHLQTTYTETRKSLEAESNLRLQQERKAKAISDQFEGLESKLRSYELHTKELGDAVMKFQAEAAEHAEEKEVHRVALAAAKEEILSLQHALAEWQAEHDHLSVHADKQQNEAANQVKRLKVAHERQVELLNGKIAELTRQLEESKAHLEESIQSSREQVQSIGKAKLAVEEQYNATQVQCNELYAMMEAIHANHLKELTKRDDVLQAEKVAAERVKGDYNAAKKELTELHHKLLREREAANELQHELRTQNINDKETAVELLTTVQGNITALNAECTVVRGKLRDLMSQVQLFKKRLDLLCESSHQSCETLKQELKHAFEILWENDKLQRSRVESSADESKRHQIAKEEEVTKALSYEEQISKLEHELALVQKTSVQMDSDNKNTIKKQAQRIDRLVEEKKEMEGKVTVLQKSLAEHAGNMRNVVDMNQKYQSNLQDLTSKNAQQKYELEQRIKTLSGQVQNIQEERDGEKRKSLALLDRVEAMTSELTKSRSECVALSVQLDKLRKENADIITKQQAALSSVGGATQQYHAQIRQTQELLKAAQEQKFELEAQNAKLRNELNQIYRQQQNNTPNTPNSSSGGGGGNGLSTSGRFQIK